MTDPADFAAPTDRPPLWHYRTGLEKALTYSSEVGTFDRVVTEVRAGRAQFWPVSLESAIVTQTCAGNVLHFWLACGDIAELQKAMPVIEAWGREQGYTKATLIGRRGWLRSFLTRLDGWRDSRLVAMEKDL